MTSGTGAAKTPSKLAEFVDFQKPFMPSPAKAARNQIRLAAEPALNRAAAGGKYFAAEGKAEAASAGAADAAAGARLWEVSQRLTGIVFDPASGSAK